MARAAPAPSRALLGSLTVGIVGAGYVGRLVIRLLKAFNASVQVYDPFLTPERAKELDVSSVSLDTVLSTSDIISLHAPVLPERPHMIGAQQLKMLRDGMIFINTARSALVDEAALVEALKENRFSPRSTSSTPSRCPPTVRSAACPTRFSLPMPPATRRIRTSAKV